jgi:hypothetical protein
MSREYRQVLDFICSDEYEQEVWKDIDEAGYYQVNQFGQIRSWVRKGDQRCEYLHTKRDTPKFIKPTPNKKDYLQFDIRTKDGRKHTFIHRAVATAFIPNPDNKPLIDHIDGNV